VTPAGFWAAASAVASAAVPWAGRPNFSSYSVAVHAAGSAVRVGASAFCAAGSVIRAIDSVFHGAGMALMELAYWSSGPCSSRSSGRRRHSSIPVGALGASVAGFVAAATSGGTDHLLLLLPLMVAVSSSVP
jgi:hypothetical protein